MSQVTYWFDEGRFKDWEKGLRKAIRHWEQYYSFIYVGLTQQKPETRFSQHQRTWAKKHKWDQMVVVFHGNTFEQMCIAEDKLIRYIKMREEKREKQNDFSCEIINDIDSQKPRYAIDPSGFWVYVLLQESHNKGGAGQLWYPP